jgi:hypothetical protein
MKLEWVIGAVREIAALGGIGHLQDIRFGARGATKGRALFSSGKARADHNFASSRMPSEETIGTLNRA